MTQTSVWDRLVGPGASRAEATGAIMAGLAGGLLAAWRASTVDASWVVLAVATLMAVDVVGGVWSNATASTRRWYHRQGAPPRSHFWFAALHIHPFLIAWMFPAFGWTGAVVLYGGTLLATVLIGSFPRRLKSPAAAVSALALLTAALIFTDPSGVEWFAPAYVLKLITGHAVPNDD